MIKIIENNKINDIIFSQPERLKVGLAESWHEIGARFNRHTEVLIKNPPKTGRIYKSHQASAPGEAPANQTGRLMKSQKYTVHSAFEMEAGATAVSKKGKPYPRFLENGTSRMLPRPFIGRTANEIEFDVIKILEQHTGLRLTQV